MSHDLNPEQLAAVRTLSGPLLVLAGAGTGKTRVITFRIANLIQHGVAPNRILAVTFTNKAAREMQQRSAALLGKRLTEKPEISTFHSLCMKILKRQITHLGYPARYAIYDRGDQESVARSVLREIRVENDTMRPADLLGHISRWKSLAVRPREAISRAMTDREHLAASAYRRYQESLKLAGAVDFDDLLLCTEELFAKFPEIKDVEALRFDHLLIDEYQDTNSIQYRVVTALAARHRNLCVVGDDDQSIYAWRGAEVTHILNFQRDWPDAKVVRLESNYRSRQPILDWANTLINFNAKRHPKTLRSSRDEGPPPRVMKYNDETQEAEGVVGEIHKAIAENRAVPSHYAILYRTNEQPRAFELELRRLKVPYVLVGGQSFFDRKEVRDLLAYLKVIVQPRDELSILRIINTPARGVSPATVKTLMAASLTQKRPLWEVLGAAAELGLSAKAVQAIQDFRQLILDFRARQGEGALSLLVRDLVERIRYKSEIERMYPTPEDQAARWASVEEVVSALASYEQQAAQASLDDFVSEAALDDRNEDRFSAEKRPRDAVTLMTLHSAKGLEFPYVYLVGMEENLLPHRRVVEDGDGSIEEERRLCYVGVTRAIDQLTLTFAKARMKWGKPRPTMPSRFLFEMTGQADHPQRLAHARMAANAAKQAVVKRPGKKRK